MRRAFKSQTFCFLDFIAQEVGTGCPPSARLIYHTLRIPIVHDDK